MDFAATLTGAVAHDLLMAYVRSHTGKGGTIRRSSMTHN